MFVSKIVFVTAFAVAMIATAVSEASAQLACGKRDEVLQHLSDKYQEAPVSLGLSSNGGILEVLTAPTGSSWTILITMPNGVSCMVAAGENWQTVSQAAQPAGPFGSGGVKH